MMTTVLQLGLCISVLCNCMSMWWMGRLLFSRDKHLHTLSVLVIALMEAKMKKDHPNVIPINSYRY